MRQPPRPPGAHLFAVRTVLVSLLQGLAVLVAVAVVYGYVLQQNAGEEEARAMAFTTIVLGNVGLILADRSRTRSVLKMLAVPNRASWWVVAGTLSRLAVVLYVPYLQQLFQFAPLAAGDLLLCAAAVVLSLLWFELYKALRSRPAAPRAVR